MSNVQEKEYIFRCGGKELAKVLYYYGLIFDTSCAEQKIVCPFHDDVNPSMMVDLSAGKYFCFGCQEAGDAFQLVRKMNDEKNDLQAGLEYFKILKSDKVNKIDLSERVKKSKKDNLQALDEAHDYYYGLNAVKWKSDKIEKEAVDAKRYMLDRGFLLETLIKYQAKITYNRNYPIIFPLLDNGEFRGWVCRTTDKEVEKKRKYLYNEGFSRSNTLVGTYGNKEYVIVVEGFIDMIKMKQNLRLLGIDEDVVAILGWKMSDEQVRKIKDSNIKYIISALDNDECGKKGTEYLKTKFKVVRFCYLKGIKDSGEMDIEQFRKMYSKTMRKIKEND